MTKAEVTFIKLAKKTNELGMMDSVSTFNRIIRTNPDGSRNAVLPNSEYVADNLKAQLKGFGGGAVVGGASAGLGASLGKKIKAIKGLGAGKLVAGITAGGAVLGALVGQSIGSVNQQQEYLADRGVAMNIFGKITDATPEAKKKYFK